MPSCDLGVVFVLTDRGKADRSNVPMVLSRTMPYDFGCTNSAAEMAKTDRDFVLMSCRLARVFARQLTVSFWSSMWYITNQPSNVLVSGQSNTSAVYIAATSYQTGRMFFKVQLDAQIAPATSLASYLTSSDTHVCSEETCITGAGLSLNHLNWEK